MRSELNRRSPFREADLDSADQEPRALHKSMSVSTYVFLAVGLFWAMNHLDNYAGGFNPSLYQRFKSINELVPRLPHDPEREALNRGFVVYSRSGCVACHQGNGLGSPGQFPPLAGSEWVAAEDPGQLIRIFWMA